jgi:hypothetical protein
MAALPRKHLLAVGRCNFIAQGTRDAWQAHDPEGNPEAWLRLYGPKLEPIFTTALRGVVPHAMVRLSEHRVLVVGTSRGTLTRAKRLEDKSFEVTESPNAGVAIVKEAVFEKQQGKNDGYFMVVECRVPE